jgi:FkbM family methyltransferase
MISLKSWIRHFLPFGIVRAMQVASRLVQLGIPPARARRLAICPDTARLLIRSNFDLLPDGTLAKVRCVVDVGANIGAWTTDLLTLSQPSRTILVEPDPRLVEGLRKRFPRDSGVEIVEAALGSVVGTAEFHLMNAPVFNSFRRPASDMERMYGDSSRIKETVNVGVRTLDSLTYETPRVDLLKIDVQGSEREVLSGAEQTLRKTTLILLEVNFQPHYEGEAGFFELDGILQRHGFKIGNFSAPMGGPRESFYANALYIRSLG